MRREERRHQANQIRRNKREETIAFKRAIGGPNSAPFLTCILPLNETIDPNQALAILSSCDSDAIIVKTKSVTHITIPRLKQRFSFIVAPFENHKNLQTLDYLKVCDSTLLLISAHNNNELLDKWGIEIFELASAQGIPTPILALMDLESIGPKKRAQTKANIQAQMNKIMPSEKMMNLDTESDGLNVFRRVGGQKRSFLFNKANRPHLFSEQLEYCEGTLKVTGFLRGAPLSVDRLVHIPGKQFLNGFPYFYIFHSNFCLSVCLSATRSTA